MTTARLILRSLCHRPASQAATALAIAISTAVITGALLVGDSVRGSLLRRVELRLGAVTHAVVSGERLVAADLAPRLSRHLSQPAAGLLEVPGVAATPDGSRRLPRVTVLGVDAAIAAMAGPAGFAVPAAGEVVLGAEAAGRLGLEPGQVVVVRAENLNAFPRDTPLAAAGARQVALRLTVKALLREDQLAGLSLRADPLSPVNLFVDRVDLCRALDLSDQVNRILLAAPTASDEAVAAALAATWRLDDVGLELRDRTGGCALTSLRIFLDPAVQRAAVALDPAAATVLTYFVTAIGRAGRESPFAFITGTDAAWLPDDLGDAGLVVNRWLADDLACGPGDTLDIRYLAVGPLQALEERRAALTVRAVVPMAPPYADPGLMPAIPGLGDAERCTDWSPGIPIDLQRIRPQDEAYWADWRGTPKAFVSLATAQRLWSNPFGAATAVHLPLSAAAAAERLRGHLEPSQVGLAALAVRHEGLRAAGQAIDFAQLFLGLSFFLIAAGLLLTGLLAGLSLDRRHSECGTLLALGFTPTRVRRLLLVEALGLAIPATLLGVGLGLLYNHAVVAGLGRLWRDSLGGLPVQAYASARSLLLGGVASGAATALVLAWVLHRLGRRQAAMLQRGSPVTPLHGRRPWRWFASGCPALGAGVALAWLGQPERGQAAAGVFFGAGALLLVGGLLWVTAALQALHRLGPGRLSLRNAARRPARSLAVSATLAAAVFLVVAVGAHRRVVPDGDGARAGTGGFAFYGETAVPILADLNSPEGRRRLRLEAPPSAGVRVLHLFAAAGDEASCLNLNRTRQPRLLGAESADMARQAAFGFARMIPEVNPDDPWAGLDLDLGEGVVPAIVDESVLVWNFGLRLGDTLTLADSRGRPLHLRFVATLSGSILQGHVLIAAGRLREAFPEAGGARVLLVQSPPEHANAAAAWLLDGLADHGLELTPSRERLAAFAAVENTYLAIFMALGGLGLVLGCFGLGAVVVRHVIERRGELALLRALGFSRRAILGQVLGEHAALLAAGLAVGLVSGLVAVLPAVAGGGTAALRQAALWCLGIAVSGLAWILAAAWWATHSRLIEGLRDE